MKFFFHVSVLFLLFVFCRIAAGQEIGESDFKAGVIYAEPVSSPAPCGDFIDACDYFDGGTGSGEIKTGSLKNEGTCSSTPSQEDEEELKELVKSYFKKDLYNGKLADWVIYINREGKVYQCILDSNKKTTPGGGTKLYHQRNIWALVFAECPDYPGPAGDTANPSLSFNVSLESLQEYTSTVQSLFNGLVATKIGVSGGVSMAGNQSVTLTVYPAYNLKTVAAAAFLSSLTELQSSVDDLIMDKDVTPDKYVTFGSELSKAASELEKLKTSDLESLEGSDNVFALKQQLDRLNGLVSRITNPQYHNKKSDDYLQGIKADLAKLNVGYQKAVSMTKWTKGIAPGKEHQFLFVGMARFALDPNTIDRLTLRIPPQYSFWKKHPLVVSNTFGNTEGSSWGLSLGLASLHTQSTAFSKDIQPDFYFLGHLYLCPPEKPWNFQSASFFLGTQAALATPYNQIVFGLDWGDPFGCPGLRELGFLGGGEFWRKPDNGFDLRWFYGINYFL